MIAGARLAVDSIVECRVEGLDPKGWALARVAGTRLRFRGAAPGERVRVRVRSVRRRRAEGRLAELLEPAVERVAPRCAHAGECGGCTWQHLGYDAQLALKREAVVRALTEAGLSDEVPPVAPVIGSQQRYGYRNRMDFDFSAARWLTHEEVASGVPCEQDFALGLHAPGSFFKVLDLTECHLPPPWCARLLGELRGLASARGWAPWNIRTHEGWLRHLVVRSAAETGEAMVNLVTSAPDEERIALLAELLRERFPEVTTFVHTVHAGRAQNAEGEPRVVFGSGVVRDRIGAVEYAISPFSFFQTNTAQAERLFGVVRDLAQLTPEQRVYDLYCGTGSIALFIAPHVASVVGLELDAAAIADARANAAANGIANAAFVAGDMKALFTPELVAVHGRPDLLIVDPPRIGMHRAVVDQILALAPKRIVSVGCNLTTQARDVGLLSQDYAIEAIQPVDLFPQTPHVENVMGLRRR